MLLNINLVHSIAKINVFIQVSHVFIVKDLEVLTTLSLIMS